MGREYCLNIAHRWKLIGVDRIGPKIYLKLPKHGGNGGNGRYTEMRSYLRERRNHTMSVSEVRGENYGGNETRRRGGRLIAVKLHLLRWTRQREREREIERGREEEERKTEREKEREREREREKRRERATERPFGRGSAFSWRVHLRKMAPVGRCVPRLHTFCTPEQRARTNAADRPRSNPNNALLLRRRHRRRHRRRRRGIRVWRGRKRNMAKKGQDLTYKRDRKRKR